MVDPSCSGSGIVSRLDSLLNTSGFTSARKEKLAKFQKQILLHALSCRVKINILCIILIYFFFLVKDAKRVVYSTCSLFEEENEQVVEAVLDIVGDEWEIHKVLPNWKHRGLTKYKVGDYCIRASPADDLTNGFFVARFHKKVIGYKREREEISNDDEPISKKSKKE